MTITNARPCSFTQLTLDSEWEDIIRTLGLRSGLYGDPTDSAGTTSFDVPGRNIVLAPCKVVIEGRLWATDANVSTAIPAASASNRIDRLVLRLNRAAGSAATVVQPVVLTGTPGSGLPPAVSYSLGGTYDVKVASWTSQSNGTLSGLTDERSFCSAGLPVCTSATRPDYFENIGLAFESDTSRIIYWNGTAWTAYNAGRQTLPASGPLTVSASMQTVPGLSASLAVGTYHVHGQLLLSVPTTGSQGLITYRLNGAGGLIASNGGASWVETHESNGVGTSVFWPLGTTINGVAPGTAGADQVVKFDGIFVVTVAGTINVQIAQAATSAISVAQFGTYLEVDPV